MTQQAFPHGKTILSLCDLTQQWPAPYKEKGYNIITIDLQRGGDVRLMQKPDEKIHGILAAPPCTVFANSGARWPRTEADMLEGLSVVDACLREEPCDCYPNSTPAERYARQHGIDNGKPSQCKCTCSGCYAPYSEVLTDTL